MRSIELNPTQMNNIANQMNSHIANYNPMAERVKSENGNPVTTVMASINKAHIQGMVNGLYAMGVIIDLHFENEDAQTGKITGWEIL